MRKFKTIFLILFLITVSILFSPLHTNHAEGFSPWPVDGITGKNAPDFTLKDISGKDIRLSSFKGSPVLLNFWATWCPYCRKERAELDSLYKEFRDSGLIIISVATDKSVQTVKRFIEKSPADYIVLTDKDGETASTYNVSGLPTSFLIDRDGKIRNKFVGFREWTGSGSKKLINDIVKK